MRVLVTQLHRRLEEVHVQPHRPIQLGQLTIGALTFEPVVPDQLPNDRAIFLFDPGLVIFVADPSASEGDLPNVTIRQQFFVDELTAVIRIDAEYREGEQATRLLERVHHAVLTTVQQRQALRPRRRDVGQSEGVQERSVGRSTAMSNQVTLEEPWLDVSPLGERAYRDLMLQQSAWFGRAQSVRLTQRTQQPIHRRRTECQQLCPGPSSVTTRWP